MSEKKKKEIQHMGTLPFIGWWTSAYGLAWGILMAGGIIIGNVVPFEILNAIPLEAFFVFGAGFIGLTTGLTQQRLIRRKFNELLAGWWWKSALAWAGTGLLWYGVLVSDFMSDFFGSFLGIFGESASIALFFALLLVPPTIVQGWLARKQIPRAWLWPVAAIVSAAMFALPLSSLLSGNFLSEFMVVALTGAGGLLQGAVMGMVMIWLLNMSQRPFSDEAESVAQDVVSDEVRQRLEDGTPVEQVSYDDLVLAQERNEDFR